MNDTDHLAANDPNDLDPEQGDKDPHVPAELIEVFEINEWLVATGQEPLKAP